MNIIYHLALQADWDEVVDNATIYYPPTYGQDGYTHGTGNLERLLEVANHFYQASQGDWVCLVMTVESLAETDVLVKFEPAANVGNQDGDFDGNQDTTNPELFPHIYGGIAPSAVHAIYSVVRNSQGGFIRITLPSD
ncbi:MAG: hypothetical protein ACJA2O_004539 [Candidatus Azotimanducaceae bacterium]